MTRLKACRECGADCRPAVFEKPIVPETTVWLCWNHEFYGGDCPSLTAYLTEEAWNDEFELVIGHLRPNDSDLENKENLAMGNSEIPTAICAYPIPGWRLDKVQFDELEGQPDGWVVSLKRERPNWRTDRREYCVMARSDVGPLEAWDEALRIAIRSDKRAKEVASEIEAERAQLAH